MIPTTFKQVIIFAEKCRLSIAVWVFPFMAHAADPLSQQGAGRQSAPPPMTDIHDIKPLAAVVRDLPWIAILIGLLILAVLPALFFYLRRLRNSIETKRAVIVLPPEIIAHRALDRISDVKMMEGKAFYFELSAILRQYIYERFKINAPEMTTEELLPRLERLSLSSELYEGLDRLCRGADPIKYAGRRPTETQMTLDLTFARGFVDGTTPGKPDTSESGGAAMETCNLITGD